MARARNLKPGFFSNEDLAECSFAARLCFAGLWTLADREGLLEDRPKRIKGELFRFDSIDVEPLLQELARFKFIVRYECDGLRCIQIPSFKNHQTPHYSEKPSGIKPPPDRELANDDEQDFRESTRSAPGSEQPLRGGRNPLNHESGIMNPDSLNPESTPTATLPVVGGGVSAESAVCVALRQAGIGEAHVGNQLLTTLVDAGATADEFLAFVPQAIAGCKGFKWILGAVQGERMRAAKLAPQLHRGAMPRAQPTAAEQRVLDAVPSIAAPHLRRVEPATVIDMEPVDGTPRRLG